MPEPTEMYKDYMIIGQGIAGSLLALNLLGHGKSVILIDADLPTSASKISSGVINPITGRKYVLSWKYEELLKELSKQYINFETLTGNKFLHEKTIIRTLSNPKEENFWYSRGEDEFKYCKEESSAYDYEGHIKNVLSYAEIDGYRLDAKAFVESASTYFKAQNSLLIEPFEYDLMNLRDEFLSYKNVVASKIIFCEGWQVKQNPYFNYLPFKPAKGEVLIIRLLEIKPQVLIKHGIFCIPLTDDFYWLGSTYEWDDLDERPTKQMKAKLIRQFEENFNLKYEIVDHLAGVRPSTNVRRPFLGQHPTYNNLYIFNGLGTKGCSLGPYFAKQMAQYLEEEKEVEESVSIRKYDGLFGKS